MPTKHDALLGITAWNYGGNYGDTHIIHVSARFGNYGDTHIIHVSARFGITVTRELELR